MIAEFNPQANILLRHDSHEAELTKNRKRLFDFIRPRVSTREDAEDLLQDVFYQFMVNFSAVEPIETVTAWLVTVARNKITDWYRKRRTSPLHDLQDAERDETNSIIEAIYDPDDNPETVLERREFWAGLSDALDTLPPAQREVFIKHEIEGYSYKEIAEETGLSIKVLLSRKHDAVVKLRKLLSKTHLLTNK